ncbi:MAG: hypothetical protein NTZ59_04500 [Bacteroidetes bacterium]|nr:hypothetical protein [Bacteroidota bacterium]
MLFFKSLILSSFLSLLHPFFVSVVDIKHNVKDKNVEISVRVFTDDLESTLKKNYKQNVDLANGSAKADVNKVVSNYIQSKLHLAINDKPQALKYIGYEIQKESVWIYVEVANITAIKKLNVNCNLLYEFQEKQSNIINATANGVEKNYKLENPNAGVEFIW